MIYVIISKDFHLAQSTDVDFSFSFSFYFQ